MTNASDRYPEVLREATRLRSRGATYQETLPSLRRLSSSIVDSIKAGRDAFGLDLGASKHIVHSSETWSDCRESFDRLHDSAEEALDER